MIMLLKKALGRFRKKPEPEKKPVPEKQEKQPWTRELFNGMLIAIETSGGFNVRLSDSGNQRIERFRTPEEVIDFLLAFEAGGSVTIEVNICGRGPLSSSMDYAAFRLLTKVCMERYKQLSGNNVNEQVEEASKETESLTSLIPQEE